jgi:hypothetical protein
MNEHQIIDLIADDLPKDVVVHGSKPPTNSLDQTDSKKSSTANEQLVKKVEGSTVSTISAESLACSKSDLTIVPIQKKDLSPQDPATKPLPVKNEVKFETITLTAIDPRPKLELVESEAPILRIIEKPAPSPATSESLCDKSASSPEKTPSPTAVVVKESMMSVSPVTKNQRNASPASNMEKDDIAKSVSQKDTSGTGAPSPKRLRHVSNVVKKDVAIEVNMPEAAKDKRKDLQESVKPQEVTQQLTPHNATGLPLASVPVGTGATLTPIPMLTSNDSELRPENKKTPQTILNSSTSGSSSNDCVVIEPSNSIKKNTADTSCLIPPEIQSILPPTLTVVPSDAPRMLSTLKTATTPSPSLSPNPNSVPLLIPTSKASNAFTLPMKDVTITSENAAKSKVSLQIPMQHKLVPVDATAAQKVTPEKPQQILLKVVSVTGDKLPTTVTASQSCKSVSPRPTTEPSEKICGITLKSSNIPTSVPVTASTCAVPVRSLENKLCIVTKPPAETNKQETSVSENKSPPVDETDKSKQPSVQKKPSVPPMSPMTTLTPSSAGPTRLDLTPPVFTSLPVSVVATGISGTKITTTEGTSYVILKHIDGSKNCKLVSGTEIPIMSTLAPSVNLKSTPPTTSLVTVGSSTPSTMIVNIQHQPTVSISTTVASTVSTSQMSQSLKSVPMTIGGKAVTLLPQAISSTGGAVTVQTPNSLTTIAASPGQPQTQKKLVTAVTQQQQISQVQVQPKPTATLAVASQVPTPQSSLQQVSTQAVQSSSPTPNMLVSSSQSSSANKTLKSRPKGKQVCEVSTLRHSSLL